MAGGVRPPGRAPLGGGLRPGGGVAARPDGDRAAGRDADAGETLAPASTYRIQLGPDLGFAGARALVPYLRWLGVSHLYLSPAFAARPGSSHGYDVVDPRRLDPARGGAAAFAELAAEARAAGMGLLLDLVPNHMAASEHNPWWWDVLEHGPASPWAATFDIDWRVPGLPPDRLLLPVLGEPYAEALGSGALRVDAEPGTGGGEARLVLRCHDRTLPLEPGSWLPALGPEAAGLGDALTGIPSFAARDATSAARRRAAAAAARRRLAALLEDPARERRIAARLGSLGEERLDGLLTAQPYWLAHWRLAAELTGYRRFFDITDLVGVRVERPAVFEATHRLLLDLVGRGLADGVRVDHVDGLLDPGGYLRRLRRRLDRVAPGGRPYLVVEKILAADERLPEGWPVDGTTGYDFLRLLDGVFVHRDGVAALDAAYRRFTDRPEGFEEAGYRGKKRVMGELFRGEMSALGRELVALAREDRRARDVGASELEGALWETTACLGVYRTYTGRRGPAAAGRARIEAAVEEAGRRGESAPRALDFVRRVLLQEDGSAGTRRRWRALARRWEQVTGPVTAKGLEDTALYRYIPLLSLNEVGGEPDAVGSVGEFHRRNRERRARWPDALLATSTHDTKRSEDVRARLHVLSEIPGEWERAVERWSAWNAGHRTAVGARRAPDPDEEILLYQTLLGAWPLDAPAGEAPGAPPAGFVDRIEAFVVKALREAKRHSDWRDPDLAYEAAVTGFLRAILDPPDAPFPADLRRLVERTAPAGALNSLGQALLTIAAPGVPDCYRGTETWDFSLVDPDNRRPVDFDRLRGMAEALERRPAGGTAARELCREWRDGRIKLLVTARALRLRRERRALFLRGDYVPLYASASAAGTTGARVCAFARRSGEAWALVAVPRLVADRVGADTLLPDPAGWGTARLVLPDGAPRDWVDAFTGERRSARSDAGLPLAELFGSFPAALMEPA